MFLILCVNTVLMVGSFFYAIVTFIVVLDFICLGFEKNKLVREILYFPPRFPPLFEKHPDSDA